MKDSILSKLIVVAPRRRHTYNEAKVKAHNDAIWAKYDAQARSTADMEKSLVLRRDLRRWNSIWLKGVKKKT